MGLLDGIREVLGMRAEADATRGADPDDLFGMSTAYVTMGADLDYDVAGQAALCFSGVDSTDFASTVEDVVAILERSREEFGTETELHEDGHGYEWVVFEDDDFEDLLSNVHFAADTFVERGYGDRLLAAVFGFSKGDVDAYWIYSFRRGSFYPFVPADPENRERDGTAEFKLQSVLDGELDVEDDREFWYPLWPSARGRHPWS